MQIRVGLETAFEGRMLGQALDFPAVFAYGADEAEVCCACLTPCWILIIGCATTDEPRSLGGPDFRLGVFRTTRLAIMK